MTLLQLNDKASPAIGATTTRFISAAEMMCRVLGMPNYKCVTIGHPISASQEILAEYARDAVDQAWRLLLRGSPNDVSVMSPFWSV